MNADEANRQALAERYVALWNLGDDEERRRTIRQLWADDGGHVSPNISVRGHEELEARVSRSQHRWVAEEGYRFRLRSAEGHHDVTRLVWEMVDRNGNVESVGTEIIVLHESGKISDVYQFIDQ
jgi:hypothetical protein